MVDPGRCPPPDELTQMLLGRLDASRSAEIEEHLDFCSRCLTRVKNLHIESQIVDLFRAHPRGESERPQPDLKQLITHLEGLRPVDAVYGGVNTDVLAETNIPRLAPAEGPDELGRLAHFRILSMLGAGGMGVVYLAEDTKLRRAIALKVLRPRYARDTEAHARFLHEARAIAAIKHDHVVVVHEVGDTLLEGDAVTTPYLAMERLEGVSLDAWLCAHPRPPLARVVRIGRQVAEALAALHSRGLVHRDLKPANLWLERIEVAGRSGESLAKSSPTSPWTPSAADFRLKLLDFGLVLTPSNGAAEPRILGTPAYMPPEQLLGEPVDPRSDLFSLGVILYELCTGELPFPDRRFVIDAPAPLPVSDFNAKIPPRLARLIGQLLEEKPDRRPESTRKVARELADIGSQLNGSPSRTRRTVLGLAIAAAAAVLVLAATFDTPLRRLFVATSVPAPVPGPITTPPEDPFCKEVRHLPPKEQFNAVVKKLAELNPTYDSKKVAGWIEPDVVLRFHEKSDRLGNIQPLQCLTDLKTVSLVGTAPGKGQVKDIEPLRGLRLAFLELMRNPDLRGIAPLRGMPLHELNISDTAVDSLADLADAPLEELRISRTPIRDLTPLRDRKQLRLLECEGCPIESLEPLVGTSLTELTFDYVPGRDADVLKRLTRLKTINGSPASEFLKK